MRQYAYKGTDDRHRRRELRLGFAGDKVSQAEEEEEEEEEVETSSGDQRRSRCNSRGFIRRRAAQSRPASK